MNSRIPYDERHVLCVVPADNAVGFEVQGRAPIDGGWLEVNLSGSPPADKTVEFFWEVIRKVNRENPAIPGHHWMTHSFTLSREVDHDRRRWAQRFSGATIVVDEGFLPMPSLSAEFLTMPGPLPEKLSDPLTHPFGDPGH